MHEYEIYRDSDTQIKCLNISCWRKLVTDSNDIMMMSDIFDIIPIGYTDYRHSTLHPFVLRMQSHNMVESGTSR